MEAESRMENIEELINKAVTYWESAEEPSLSAFLEEVALVADIDSMDESEDRIILMTLHSAKGLEFPYVYIGDGKMDLFPSMMSRGRTGGIGGGAPSLLCGDHEGGKGA